MVPYLQANKKCCTATGQRDRDERTDHGQAHFHHRCAGAADAGGLRGHVLEQRHHRAGAARHRSRLCDHLPGLQLPRPAREPRERARQRAAGNAALPARGARGRHRPRLCPRHRQAAGRHRAQQRRRHACVDGDLQCLVRPRADDHSRRHRAAQFRATAHAHRLAAQRRRPGRAGASLRQMGRPAAVGQGGGGVGTARPPDGDHRAQGAGLYHARSTAAGRQFPLRQRRQTERRALCGAALAGA